MSCYLCFNKYNFMHSRLNLEYHKLNSSLLEMFKKNHLTIYRIASNNANNNLFYCAQEHKYTNKYFEIIANLICATLCTFCCYCMNQYALNRLFRIKMNSICPKAFPTLCPFSTENCVLNTKSFKINLLKQNTTNKHVSNTH